MGGLGSPQTRGSAIDGEVGSLSQLGPASIGQRCKCTVTNIYDKTIRTLREAKTIPQHIKSLGGIRLESEDWELTARIEGVLNALLYFLQQGSSKSTPLPLDLVPIPPASQLIAYCDLQRSHRKPEWQVIAERKGWRPPHTGSL